jgi:hypothetical protein
MQYVQPPILAALRYECGTEYFSGSRRILLADDYSLAVDLSKSAFMLGCRNWRYSLAKMVLVIRICLTTPLHIIGL